MPMRRLKKPVPAPRMPRLLTTQEVSDYLRVSSATIYRLLRSGQIPGFLVGADWRFDIDALTRWSQRDRQ